MRRVSFRPSDQPNCKPSFASSNSNSHSPLRLIQSGRTKSGRGYSGLGILEVSGVINLFPIEANDLSYQGYPGSYDLYRSSSKCPRLSVSPDKPIVPLDLLKTHA